MTQFFVNDMEVILKDGASFDFYSENPDFSESEGYTLSLEFPLRGCPQNQRAFGHVYRMDVHKPVALMKAAICSGHFSKAGSLAVLEVSEDSLKGQFLEGVRPDGGDTPASDSLFVDELDLGKPQFTSPKDITPEDARTGTTNEVCFPWMPEGYEVLNNRADRFDVWNAETRSLSWLPYLLPMLRRIAEAAGYRISLGSLDDSHWQWAVICNVLPNSWGMQDYNLIMPHWTVREFFSKLSPVVRGAFTFDESNKEISFESFREATAKTVYLRDVVDEYTSAVSRDEQDADYMPQKHYRYRAASNVQWKYLDAPWMRRYWLKNAAVYEKFADVGKMVYDDKGHRHYPSGSGPVIYVRELDTYFVYRRAVIYSKGHVSDQISGQYPYASFYYPQPVDVFGPVEYDRDDPKDYEELDFVPAIVDYNLFGKTLIVPVGSYEGDVDTMDNDAFIDDAGKGMSVDNGTVHLSEELKIFYTRMESTVEQHEEESGAGEYFDRVYLAFALPSTRDRILKAPVVDMDVDFKNQEILNDVPFLRLGGGAGEGARDIEIDPKVKYTVSFITDSLPDVSAVFVIRGQKYICKKLVATFTTSGMKKVVKGEFYKVVSQDTP